MSASSGARPVPVQVAALVRSYGRVRAVDGITFDVAAGETVGIIGPDGAGKTTILRTVLGLLRPDSGVVRTCGLDPFADARALSRRVGYLAQRFSLYGDLSVDENIAFFAEVHGVRDWKPVRASLLERLRLAPFRDRLAERLSGGMKQKLALACTLVHTPELLVLDEPSTGVDPVSRRDFWRILAELQREGLTILLTTPYLDEAERCHRVALVDRGHLLRLDAPDAIRSAATGRIVEVIAEPKARAMEIVRTLPGVRDVQSFGERLHATVGRESVEEDLARIASALGAGGIEVRGARTMEPSLEDIYIAELQARDGAAA